jgi:hypothetical protein
LAVPRDSIRLLHTFHTRFTEPIKEDFAAEWKSV